MYPYTRVYTHNFSRSNVITGQINPITHNNAEQLCSRGAINIECRVNRNNCPTISQHDRI